MPNDTGPTEQMATADFETEVKPANRVGHRRGLLIWAAIFWMVPLLVISVMVVLAPLKRTVTPLYHEAAQNWWAGQNLYQGPSGMNYLPHFAILFSPFHALPAPWGDVLWRVFAAGLLGSGLWRVTRSQFDSDWQVPFLWASVISLPLCMGALRNGQANALFAGLTLHAAACLPRQQWWGAATLLALALAVKPLGIVLMGLAAVVYPPLRWRVLVSLLALGLVPFLFARPAYVLAQHRGLIGNLQACAVVTEHRFADINGIVRTFGGELPPNVSKGVRLSAGALVLGLCWLGAKRIGEPLRASWLHALAVSYLMLFNPMNEANSYVILAPALGIWAVYFLYQTPARWLGKTIVFFALSMGLLPNLVRPVFKNYFALVWHPVMTLLFLGLLICYFWQRKASVQPAPAWKE